MTETRAPRHFWRRVFAFFIDYALAFALTAVVLLPFLKPDETGLRLSEYPVHFERCAFIKEPPQALLDYVAPYSVSQGKFCRQYSFGIYNGSVNSYELTPPRGEESRATQTLHFWVKSNGEVIPQVYEPQSVMIWFAVLLGSAALMRAGRQSPGKRLLGLRVSGSGCALCREIRRIGPLLVLSALTFTLSLIGPPASMLQPGLAVAVLALIAAAFSVYYIWPWLRWRGAMPWDRTTGFVVTKTT